jgi:hypothetical protein
MEYMHNFDGKPVWKWMLKKPRCWDNTEDDRVEVDNEDIRWMEPISVLATLGLLIILPAVPWLDT